MIATVALALVAAAAGASPTFAATAVAASAGPTAPVCIATAVRREGLSGHDEQDVTVSDASGVASVGGVQIANGEVVAGGTSFREPFGGLGWSDPQRWVVSSRGVGSASEVDGALQLSIGQGFPNEIGAIAPHTLHGDTDVVFSYQWQTLGSLTGANRSSGAELEVWLRGSGDWLGGGGPDERWPSSGYAFYPSNFDDDNPPQTGKNQAIVRLRHNAVSLVGYVDMDPPIDLQKRWARVRIETTDAGTVIKVRRWADGAQEPAGWDATLTDTQGDPPPSGVLQMNLIAESTNPSPASVLIDEVRLDRISALDAADAPEPGFSGTRIDDQPTTSFATTPASAVLTAVKATQGAVTSWSFDATNAAGSTTHCE